MLAKNARELIPGRFDWPGIGKQVEKVYDELYARRISSQPAALAEVRG